MNDIDTPLENVTIRVVDILSGYIALKHDLDSPRHSFTQADIDKGLVVFVHTSMYFNTDILKINDYLHQLIVCPN